MELQTKERLSRWTRDGDTAVVLTNLDLDIFKLLNAYKFSRADFAAMLLGRSAKKMSERLNLLYREPNCYLERPAAQRQYVNANYRYLIYELGTRAKEELRKRGIDIEEQRMGGHRHFAHAMMICDSLQSLQLGITGNARLIPWKEITEGPRFPADGSTVIPVDTAHKFKNGKTEHHKFDYTPDACIAVHYTFGAYRTFVLEAEHANRVWCNNLEQTSFLKKYRAIEDIIARKLHRQHWGVSSFFVLVVSNNAEHIESMKRLVAQLDPERRVSPFILFREVRAMEDLIPAKPMPDLWGMWQRAGLPDFDISQP
jgi:hypothetical protein